MNNTLTNTITGIPVLSSYRELPAPHNIRDILIYAAENYKDEIAYIIKTKRATKTEPAEYVHKSFIDTLEDVRDLGAGLIKKGFVNNRLAIIGINSYNWLRIYYAQLCGLGVVVPLDKELPKDEIVLSINRAKVDVLAFDKKHAALIEEIRQEGSTCVKDWICLDDVEGYTNIDEISDIGKNNNALRKQFSNLPIDNDAMNILLFTSGTSGLAKAVMLSQENVCYSVKGCIDTEDIQRGDVNIAFLPLHHTFGSTGQVMYHYVGIRTVFCDGLKYIQKNLIEYKVSVFICVPLIIESMYKKVMAEIKKQGKERKFNFGRKLSAFLLKFGIDRRRKIFKEVLDQLGGNIRSIISGASPLNPDVSRGLDELGITVCQGYGMTETAPVIASESFIHRGAGSVGRPLPGTDAQIWNVDENGVGELVVKSPGVMLGYYENEEATREIMEGGYLHTGDLARLENGLLYICGRAKNMIVLKNGKKIFPEEIEDLIGFLPYVNEVLVYGAQRDEGGSDADMVVTARIVYNPEWFENNHPELDSEGIYQLVRADMDKISDTLPGYKRIYRVELTLDPMEKTTTGKIKRYKQILPTSVPAGSAV